jgi:hypothetical protein
MKKLLLVLIAMGTVISLPVQADEDRGDHNWNDEYWHHNHEGYWHGHKGHWEYQHHKHTFIQVGPVTVERIILDPTLVSAEQLQDAIGN